jgi:hypothetical protein
MLVAADELCILFCESFICVRTRFGLTDGLRVPIGFRFLFFCFLLATVITNALRGQSAVRLPARIVSPANQAGVVVEGLSNPRHLVSEAPSAEDYIKSSKNAKKSAASLAQVPFQTLTYPLANKKRIW